MPKGKIEVSVIELPKFKRVVAAVSKLGVVQTDGYFCTCEKRFDNPMSVNHSKRCTELHMALSDLVK